nr:glycoside hydrolase/phage tail family protein [uncultured Shimia sp.]
MATLLLSAAGAAIGGSLGGTLAGVSSVAIGRLVGATLGRSVDQAIMGQGSDVVDSGRVDRFRITGAAEGSAVPQLYGRMRLGGQVIWATQFTETVATSGGGKGAAPQPQVREHSYSVSLAIALCEGEISRVGRIWADGVEISARDLNMRVYKGEREQLPDPLIEAVEGTGSVPAYRGTAYVVMENVQLAQFGNRIPQFSFEVVRPAPKDLAASEGEIAHAVRAVALMPGTGEYALATTPVHYSNGPGQNWSANENTPSGETDFRASLTAMDDELPACDAVSLVVSWFGNDLRCGTCAIQPKVERSDTEGVNMPWSVAGMTRSGAQEIARVADRPIYGGTPTDLSVVQSIQSMAAAGKEVMFYPFVLMDQLSENGLADPWSEAGDQPVLPWRGRITTSKAPTQSGTSDGTPQAESEVEAFFGTADASDFNISGETVQYSGPAEWRYRRFILHYAALCKAAGGVSAFCIGSEMRGLTQIRGSGGQFIAVEALRDLLVQVRAILGPDTKIGYAADWSEYFGYHPQDGTGDVYFHLDPLWADENIDFVGIDNYMPLSDWRDGADHADAHHRSIYDIDYLRGNVAGGEGYDWYYHSQEAREAQIRTPIQDGAHGEDWLFRYKDIAGWWRHAHHNRINGTRQQEATAWIPESKPVWFTELGCAAVNKGTNQPNKFLDTKSSESALPRYSDGRRDDAIQQQYIRAMTSYWAQDAHNPISVQYGAPMVDMARAFVWAWDARPYPHFPNNRGLWSDGENYARGHWINGRSGARSLASVVAEICARAGVLSYDVSGLHGVVRGYAVDDISDARASLQPLMLQHGFDAIERDGTLGFAMRDGSNVRELALETLAISAELEGDIEKTRGADAETAGRVRVQFVQADGDFQTLSEEAILPDEATHAVATSQLPLSITRVEGRQVAERWLAEARLAREGVRLALPPSNCGIGAGDTVSLPEQGGRGLYRVDRVEQGPHQMLEAVRIEPTVYEPAGYDDDLVSLKPFVPPVPVLPQFMDLPLLTGDEIPHAPHLAISAKPWPGSVAVYDAYDDSGYRLNQVVTARATVGHTQTQMVAAQAGRWDLGDALQVKLVSGAFESISQDAVLAGGNLVAIGDGSAENWELFQFQDAQLVGPDTWWLTRRLRGQLGTDGLMPAVWPEGSVVVLMESSVKQIDLASSTRNTARHFRIGPAARGYDDPSYVHRQEAFPGVGLRPYTPCHLSATPSTEGTAISWVRRTRRDGDSWDTPDVPLNEESEKYLVRVIQNGTVKREVTAVQPYWTYSAAHQAQDNLSGPFQVQVAQMSASFGPGLFATLNIAA